MRKLTTFLLISLLSISAFAQDETVNDTIKPWKFGGVTSLTFSQVSLTNWTAGGENSYSLNGILSLNANYKKDKTIWENSLDLGYGIMKQGDAETKKTDDKIDFLSKFGYQASKKLYYSGLVNFKSQMDKGYQYDDDNNTKTVISELMSPAYLILSLGMEYKPSDKFYAYLSPVTGKMTFVLDDTLSAAGAFGVEAGETSRSEFGGYAKFAYKDEIFKNVSLSTKLDLFSNYMKNPQNIDVSWEVLIAMKVNKFLTANISTHLIYDDDVDIDNDPSNGKNANVQFKEVFGVGLSFNF